MLTLSPATPLVNPAVLPCPAASPDRYTIREVWIAGFDLGLAGAPLVVPTDLAGDLADEFRNGHWSGFDSCDSNRLDHTSADELEDLGFQLGFAGIIAEPVGPLSAAERRAFSDGHNAGDYALWTIDPLFSEHLRQQAERARADAAYLASVSAVDPVTTWHPSELAEATGRTL